MRRVRRRGRETLDRIGPRHTETRVIADATEYWSNPDERAWEGNSHWRNGIPGQFEQVGRDHLALFDKLARVLGRVPATTTVVEWGSGGGANAVAFAPRAEKFVAVDVVAASLEECERRTTEACATPFVPVLLDVEDPEAALDRIGRGTCDVFLCLYVMELLPSPEYAKRVLAVARALLTSDGVLFTQIKYRDSQDRSPHRRNYARNLASQTIFPVDVFWQVATECGFEPQVMTLVPENELDRNYAYLLLTPSSG